MEAFLSLCFVIFYLRYTRQKDCCHTFEIQGQQLEQANPGMDDTISSFNPVPDRDMDSENNFLINNNIAMLHDRLFILSVL